MALFSGCCGAPVDSDLMICTDCLEHCDGDVFDDDADPDDDGVYDPTNEWERRSHFRPDEDHYKYEGI